MKIWVPICVFLFSACTSASQGNEPEQAGGSPTGSAGEDGSGGKVRSGNQGGADVPSQPSGSSAGAGGSDGKGGSSSGHTGVGGSGTGVGGSGGKAGTGGSTGAGGGKAGSGGGTAAGGKAGNGNASGGSTGTGGKKEAGGSAGMSKVEEDAGPKPGNSNHVFLLLGQSNMAGYSAAQDSDKQKNQQIQVLGFDACSATGRKQDQWDVAVPPLHECFQGALGPGDWFSKTIISKYPSGDTVWLVPCALSGQAISVMSKGGSKWSWLIDRAKKGQQKGPIEGMLFHQGESDCGDSGWPAKVKQMYQDLKSELGLTQDVPFLAGELPPASQCSTHTPLVDKLPSVMGSNTYVISAEGLVLDPADTQWHMHLDHNSQVTFGKRYAETMIKALGL